LADGEASEGEEMNRIRNVGVGARLGAAFGFVTMLLVAVVFTGISGIETQRDALRDTSNSQSIRREVLMLNFHAANFNGLQNSYALEVVDGAGDILPEDSPSRPAFVQAVADFREQVAKVAGLVKPDERPQVVELATDIDEYAAIDDRVVSLFSDGTPEGRSEATGLVVTESNDLFYHLAGEVEVLADSVIADAARSQAEANDAADRVRSLMLGAGAMSVLAAIGLAVAITLSLTRPLRRVKDVLGSVAEGDLSSRVTSTSGDEVGQMGVALNHTLDRMGGTIETIIASALTLSSASEELSVVSQDMSGTAEETAAQAASVSAAAEQVSTNLLAVSAGAEELGASILEIARNTTDAAGVAAQAVSAAFSTNETVLKLGTSASEIGEVIRVITSIAEQTNLLALNATIEAARAGEGGKGFAVVANEVKDLARKTARSSEEIGRKIETIQADTRHAVAAIAQITAIIGEINDIQTVVAAAVEEQAVTTSEMSTSVTEAAAGSSDIARNIIGVADAASATTAGAANTHGSAEELARLANELLAVVGHFVVSPTTSAATPAPTHAAAAFDDHSSNGGSGPFVGNGAFRRDRPWDGPGAGSGREASGRQAALAAAAHRRP
jgi:methyl-accepting chemotaxis protein